MDWQPIDTAPKEQDKPILLLLTSGHPQVCSWESEVFTEGVWINWLNGEYYGLPVHPDPTHWMPIPDLIHTTS